MASRILAAHQLNYLLWLGYLYKAGQADVFVLADDVQYTKHGYINRNRVRTRGRMGQLLGEVELEMDQPWGRKHINTIEWNYHNAPFFDLYMPALQDVLGAAPQRLKELNLSLFIYLLKQLEIDTEIRLSSELELLSCR
jgi:hypothetical protein